MTQRKINKHFQPKRRFQGCKLVSRIAIFRVQDSKVAAFQGSKILRFQIPESKFCNVEISRGKVAGSKIWIGKVPGFEESKHQRSGVPRVWV
jgi:hypothetical protein